MTHNSINEQELAGSLKLAQETEQKTQELANFILAIDQKYEKRIAGI